ncbi:hypothetical protein M231_01337 [Tremella mesenterica]|uniref:Uncharacterized protein n=1 Tax=Tremella mesenterica TaxID=5217 RepID=A0A4Q1BTM0_TREME|nr:hypothetical protein M231_01337 [Tremella mesenterica]
MPSCRVTNLTTHKLNICLKQVTALHFENGVEPGQTVKFKPGKVWFTFEALVDDGEKKTRYSILKSAATIALLSVAVGAAVATAGVALLPEAAALEAAAAASIAGGFIAKGMIITKGALIAHSGSIAKLSSIALPRTIDRLSAELGGLTALQREGKKSSLFFSHLSSSTTYLRGPLHFATDVYFSPSTVREGSLGVDMTRRRLRVQGQIRLYKFGICQKLKGSLADVQVLSIIASPTLSSDVRTKALSLLSQLHTAYTADQAQSTPRQIQNVPAIDPPASSTISKDTVNQGGSWWDNLWVQVAPSVPVKDTNLVQSSSTKGKQPESGSLRNVGKSIQVEKVNSVNRAGPSDLEKDKNAERGLVKLWMGRPRAVPTLQPKDDGHLLKNVKPQQNKSVSKVVNSSSSSGISGGNQEKTNLTQWSLGRFIKDDKPKLPIPIEKGVSVGHAKAIQVKRTPLQEGTTVMKGTTMKKDMPVTKGTTMKKEIPVTKGTTMKKEITVTKGTPTKKVITVTKGIATKKETTDDKREKSFWKTSLIDPTRKSDKPLPLPPSDDRVEGRAIRTGEILRIHGIYMNKRREFEVRSGEKGRLELWDKSEEKMVG